MPKEDIIEQAKDIIEKGKEKGYLTLQEILDLLPSNFDSIKRLDDIFYALDEMGIKIIDRDTERVRHFENDKVIAPAFWMENAKDWLKLMEWK